MKCVKWNDSLSCFVYISVCATSASMIALIALIAGSGCASAYFCGCSLYVLGFALLRTWHIHCMISGCDRKLTFDSFFIS